MKAKEKYDTRLQMAEMHDKFLTDLESAMNSKNYVEASWLCYSMIEQRISRLIAKYIDYCPIPPRTDDKTAAISTRIKCLKKQINTGYGVFKEFDISILDDVVRWCEKRNTLTHGLVELEHYKKYNKEFKELATEGKTVTLKLYVEASKLREAWYKAEEPKEDFPNSKCRCKSAQCIKKDTI